MFVCLLLLSLLVATHAELGSNLDGDFPEGPNDGFSCHWYEGGSGTKSLNRNFRVVCSKKNQQSYECTYRGNPHGCKAYNKNQEKYYKCLSREAAKATGCTKASLSCGSGKFKKCGDIDFTKEGRLERLHFEREEIDEEIRRDF